ncbi:MAG: DUF1566 domain-containing protein [bacterium]
MRQRFKNLIIFCGAFFIFAPLFVFGQEISTTLKEKQAIDLIGIIRKFPLTDAQRDFYEQSIYDAGSDYSIKTGAVMLTKQAILQSELDYWFVKMGVEFSKRFIKAVYKLLPAVAYGDFSGAIDLIEKYTVEQANKYIDDWLKQNQVLIGSGIGKYDFWSFKNNWQVINVPYIIVYSPIGVNKAKIVVEFYSKTAIEPPQNRGGVGSLGGNQDHIQSTVWPWDRWITSKYNKNNKIEPFIVRVKGQVVKDKSGNFTWDKTVEAPTVEVEFGKPVPEIDQSDIILKNLEANQSQGFIKDKINAIKQKAQGIVDQIKNFFEIFNSPKPTAQISDFAKPAEDSPLPNTEEMVKPSPLPLENIAKKSQEIADQADTTVNEDNATTVEQVVETMQKQVEQKIQAIATTSQAVATTSKVVATTSPPIIQPVICSQATNQEPDFDKVIFSEIAWMGSVKSASDEWIELKNISVKQLDLNGWQIFNKSQNLKIFFTTTTIIEAGGFLLLERTNDDTVPKIKADYIYTGALANAGEMLYLVGKGCALQDRIKAMPYWPEGDNITKETMERNQFYGWQTSSIVGGTPRAKNSVGKTKSSGGSGGIATNNTLASPGQATATSTASSTQQATTTQQATSTEQATTTQNSTSSQQATTTQQATSTPQATSTQQATTTVQASLLDVVINEIAWMGTQASANDEWIELYNNTDQEINLTGWKIFGIGASPVSLTGKIPSRGFYLLERTSSTTVSDIVEDQIYTGALSNSGEKLELKDSQGNVIDDVDCSAGWFAGDNSATTSRKTMERKSPVISGSSQTNWASNNVTTINGLDANNNLILGTPKAQNSILENLAPEPPKDFNLSSQIQSQKNSAFLTWATSTDLDTPTSQLSYAIYYSHYSKQLLDEQTATSTNVFVQIATTSATSLFLENLDFANVYYFTARAFDGFAYSAISSTTTMATPLAPTTNLMAVPSTVRGSVDLFWVCPYFNDYSTGIPIVVDSYIIKMDRQEITTTTWDTAQTISQNIAPKPAGEVENFSVDNLPTDSKTYFAIKYTGLSYRTSTISNIVSATAWPGFQDNGDTLTDLRTNLTWAKNANDAINNFGASSTQDEANAFITQQNSEWRLANFKELASLIEYKPTAPITSIGFENISSGKYWATGTRDVGSNGFGLPHTYNGWYADFSNGQINKDYFSGSQSQLYPFMAVKGSAIPGGMENDNFDFTNNNDGTVNDNRTGLMWLKADFAVLNAGARFGLGWQNAFYYANNAVLCNDGTLQGTYNVAGDCSNHNGVKYDDFRLPNIQEIMEITKLGNSEILPWMSGYSYFYWSSTIFDENNFWFAGESYNTGTISPAIKSWESNVQLVRDP